MTTIQVRRLDRPQYEGDWHDAPLKWTVIGPSSEVQNFETRKNAELYARLRRRTASMNEAARAYASHIL